MFGFPFRLVDPEQFPFRASAGALEAVAGYARQARGVGQGIIDNVTAVHQVWKNLDENIRTSAAPDLPERFGPIAHDGKDRGQALLDSADAMDLFVEDMSEHHDDLKKVTREARVLHDEVVHGVWIDAGNLRNPAVTTSGAASANPWDGSGAVMPIPGEQVQIPWYEHVPSVDRNQALWTRHDAVAERIREAKQALNDRLVAITAGFGLKNGKIPSQARQTLRILADAGLDEVDEMTADKIGQAIADQMNAAAGGGKDADNHLLEAMLDWFGDDPAVMNAAFAALGGTTTSELINNIANRERPDLERRFLGCYINARFNGNEMRLAHMASGTSTDQPGDGWVSWWHDLWDVPDSLEGSVPLDERKPPDEILKEYQVNGAGKMVDWAPSGFDIDVANNLGFVPEGTLDPRKVTPAEAEQLNGLNRLDQYIFGEVYGRSFDETEERFPSGDGNDNHKDAFRHAYWNALLVREFGPDWAHNFATAHEQIPKNPGAREAMDLHNNDIGRQIAQGNRRASHGQLADLVEEAVGNGRMVVVSPDGKSLEYTDQISPNDTGNADSGPELPGENPDWKKEY